MKWKQLAGLLPLLPLLLLGCETRASSPRGFRLPDGDAVAGRAAFVELNCTKCHTVEGEEFKGATRHETIDVPIGGLVTKVRSYGELVTAIIYPSYDLARGCDPEQVSKDGESLMVDANDSMTVQQMIDLVAFLQPKYVEAAPGDYEPFAP